MVTPLAPVNPVPLIVTAVPPAAAPLVGEMDATVGGVAGVQLATPVRIKGESVAYLAVRFS